MHGGDVFAFVLPFEGVVGKLDVYAACKQGLPQHGGLFALGDAVGGNERGGDLAVVRHIVGRL